MNIKRELYSQWASTAYVAVISILLTVIIARELEPSLFGIYNYVITVIAIFGIFQDGGFKTLIFREVTSKTKAIQYSRDQILKISIGHSIIITAIGCLIVILFFKNYKSTLILGIICWCITTIHEFYIADQRGRGDFLKASICQGIKRTFTAVTIITALCLNIKNISMLFIFWSIGIILSITVNFGRDVIKIPIFLPKKIIYNTCYSFIVIDLSTSIYFRSDIILLKYLRNSEEETGQYAAAFRLIEGVILLMAPIANLCFRSFRLKWQEIKKFRKLFNKILIVTSIISLLILILGLNFGKKAALLVYGNDYYVASELIIYLTPSLIFILPNYIISQALIALNIENNYAFISIFAAIFNVCINWIFIPHYGVKAAALSTVATEVLLFVCMFVFYKIYSK
jgi:O-antigen/teichoic acid export membrane protein